jgi:hypothetical protein
MEKDDLNPHITGLMADYKSVVNSLAACYCNACKAGLYTRCDARMIKVNR